MDGHAGVTDRVEHVHDRVEQADDFAGGVLAAADNSLCCETADGRDHVEAQRHGECQVLSITIRNDEVALLHKLRRLLVIKASSRKHQCLDHTPQHAACNDLATKRASQGAGHHCRTLNGSVKEREQSAHLRSLDALLVEVDGDLFGGHSGLLLGVVRTHTFADELVAGNDVCRQTNRVFQRLVVVAQEIKQRCSTFAHRLHWHLELAARSEELAQR